MNGFQDLRGGGVATHMSMIFALLFHQFVFDQLLQEKMLKDSQNVKNVNYIIKGLQRLFEDDLESQNSNFVQIFVLLYKFLEKVEFISINSIFDEFMILFARYYLHYVPTIK